MVSLRTGLIFSRFVFDHRSVTAYGSEAGGRDECHDGILSPRVPHAALNESGKLIIFHQFSRSNSTSVKRKSDREEKRTDFSHPIQSNEALKPLKARRDLFSLAGTSENVDDITDEVCSKLGCHDMR